MSQIDVILFCADPLRARAIDPSYADEREAAIAAGFTTGLISFEALVDESDAERAIQCVSVTETPLTALYRGWMMRPADYARLYQALRDRNITLINDPAAYRHTHYLPESYAIIEGHTPRTVWLPTGPEVDFDEVLALLAPFGEKPLILKDYVKSRKHDWYEACFIPSAADREAIERITHRFVALQGADLAEGLVFREFMSFQPIGTHAQSDMPLTREYRIFWRDGEPMIWANYWEDGDYGTITPPIETFREVASRVQSCFFTMDIAQTTEDDWLIVELGDGQVAGLPERINVMSFYQALQGKKGS